MKRSSTAFPDPPRPVHVSTLIPWPRALCAALLLAVPAANVEAQGAAASPYHPGIDVLDYDVALELPDTGSFIRGDVTVTARRSGAARLLRLDLVRGLTVREVTLDGAPVELVRTDTALLVSLDSARRDTVKVRVRYDGVVTDGLIVQRDSRGRWTWFGDNWPNRARHWLPTVDHPSDKASVTFTVRAPEGRTVVANGSSLGVRHLSGADAGRSETRWREPRPIPTYLMVIGVGPLERTALAPGRCAASATHRCVPQAVYAMPESRGYLPGPFAAAPAMVAFFERIVGPFPYEQLAHVQSATRFGGMENAGAIFYADRLFKDRAVSEGLIAHETAHQWFGDAVTEREWSDLWLSEGFATYYAALWTRHAHGEPAFVRELAEIRDQVMTDSVVAARPVLDTAQRDLLALLNTNSYQKGGYILAMLHRQLGDSAFHAGARAYYAAHRDGNATTDDLRRAMERSSGQPLAQFFDQWLRRPGFATPVVGWAHDATTGAVRLLVLQEGPALPYELATTVAVTERTGGVRRVAVRFPANRRAELALPGSFPVKPARVVADPDRHLLARITTP